MNEEADATDAFQNLAMQFVDGPRWKEIREDVLSAALEAVGLPGDLSDLLRDEIEARQAMAA